MSECSRAAGAPLRAGGAEGPQFAFGPADHVQLLHPKGRRGVATVAQGGASWTERTVTIEELPAYVTVRAGEADLYVSQQTFYGRRRIAYLAQLGASYVDLDFHRTARWSGADPEWVTDALLRTLRDQNVSSPSYVLSTGRGLLAVWLHDLVPRAALPRWMAIQKRLSRMLDQFGADLRALDAARVFRIAGTRNGKSLTVVRPTYFAAPPSALARWDFEDLARELLPLERAEVVSLRVRRAERRARSGGNSPVRTLSAASYWETVLADLQRLLSLRWHGQLPPGERDAWLFVACVAISWITPSFVLRREFYTLALEVGCWSEQEAGSRMASVFQRAEAAAAGRKAEWEGKIIDPRYRLRASTIVDWLRIEPAEMRTAYLRVLVDRDIARERAAERKRESRRRQGTQERVAYEAAASRRAETVAALRSSGLQWAEVAAQAGLSSANAARFLVARWSRR
jgi:hypothetical protein